MLYKYEIKKEVKDVLYHHDDTIDKFIQELEEFGYTSEEALNIIENACRSFEKGLNGMQILSAEIDTWNSLDCISFQLTSEEIKEQMEKCKKRYKEDIRSECLNCLWFNNNTNKRHCTINKDI